VDVLARADYGGLTAIVGKDTAVSTQFRLEEPAL
jgi:hypothetical protein